MTEARTNDRRNQRRRVNGVIPLMLALWWVLLVPALAVLPAVADEELERRTILGIKLFRATLAADTAIADKAGEGGALSLVLFFRGDRALAEELAARLSEAGAIRGTPIRVALSDDPSFTAFGDAPPTAIFLADEPDDGETLDRLVAYAETHRSLFFLPFRGHVERGAGAGLFIAAKVRPYLNLRSLEASGITLRPFFLRISKTVEERP